MKKLQSLFNSANAKKASFVALAVTASSSVFAVDYTDQISAAVADGSTNVTAVIAGSIALGVIGFGVGHILGWFKKG